METTKENTKESILRQLVIVRLGEEEYGIDIGFVHDIHRMVKITAIPQAPKYFLGVINLRGKIVPVVDFRLLFELKEYSDNSHEKRIVVIESDGNTVGFIVDSVREVLRIPQSSIKEPPEIIKTQVDKRYLEGVAQLDERLIIVLNIGVIFSNL